MNAQQKPLLEIFHAALRRVRGGGCVSDWLTANKIAPPVYLVAIGKAAAAMTQGALQTLGEKIVRGLVITKAGHLDYTLQKNATLTCIEAGHPLPDEGSLYAGAELLQFLAAVPVDVSILFLLSGGASSLVEVLPEAVSLDDLQRVNRWLLSSGLDISHMNSLRKSVSCIKAGRLLEYLGAQDIQVLLISDVPGDDVATIGSGLLLPQPVEKIDMHALPKWIVDLCGCAHDRSQVKENIVVHVDHHIVATNRDALQAACDKARALGYPCTLHDELLRGDAVDTGKRLAHAVRQGPLGIQVWGGETTVYLPETPGRGGRNQSLALSAAMELQGADGVFLLAAGSDGTDGPGEDAGALVDGDTIARGRLEGLDAEEFLAAADAGTFLEASGDLLHTGPTGSNVMDIVIGLKV